MPARKWRGTLSSDNGFSNTFQQNVSYLLKCSSRVPWTRQRRRVTWACCCDSPETLALQPAKPRPMFGFCCSNLLECVLLASKLIQEEDLAYQRRVVRFAVRSKTKLYPCPVDDVVRLEDKAKIDYNLTSRPSVVVPY